MKLKNTWLFVAVFVVGAALSTGCGEPGETGFSMGPHPIVVLDLSTLRADHLGCYGYAQATSPNIDTLATESVRFEWAFSQGPNTPPSLASILTGLYPSTHGMISQENRLSDEAVTLAEALLDVGYVTAAFVDGAYMSRDFGLTQGFSHYDNSRGAGLAEIGPKVIAWLKEHASDDFLLWIHTYDVHAPYAPPQEYRQMFTQNLEPPSEGFEASAEQLEAVRMPAESSEPRLLPPHDLAYAKALYDGEIRYVDSWMGRIMEEIRRLGLDERATIILVSDHGEAFQEHGSLLHDQMYTPVTHVPLLVRLPHGEHAGTVSHVVETMDLMPTVLDLVGTSMPPGMQGESLLPLVHGEGTPPYLAYGESSFFGGQSFVAMEDYRMHLDGEGRVELYDFRQDSLEQKDLASLEGRRVEVLKRRLEVWKETVARASLGEETAPLNDDTLEQLRSLGYIQ